MIDIKVISILQKIFFKISPIYKFIIKGKSMEPLFGEGDLVIVDKIRYLFLKPKKGDLIALKRRGKFIIKYIDKIKNDKYYVLGRNARESTDSRAFGWIRKKEILGKVIFKI